MGKSGKYDLYVYRVGNEDDHEEWEATATQKYEVGEKVRSWFDSKYNTAKIGKLCQKCLKPYNEETAVKHEFCQLNHN